MLEAAIEREEKEKEEEEREQEKEMHTGVMEAHKKQQKQKERARQREKDKNDGNTRSKRRRTPRPVEDSEATITEEDTNSDKDKCNGEEGGDSSEEENTESLPDDVDPEIKAWHDRVAYKRSRAKNFLKSLDVENAKQTEKIKEAMKKTRKRKVASTSTKEKLPKQPRRTRANSQTTQGEEEEKNDEEDAAIVTDESKDSGNDDEVGSEEQKMYYTKDGDLITDAAIIKEFDEKCFNYDEMGEEVHHLNEPPYLKVRQEKVPRKGYEEQIEVNWKSGGPMWMVAFPQYEEEFYELLKDTTKVVGTIQPHKNNTLDVAVEGQLSKPPTPEKKKRSPSKKGGAKKRGRPRKN